MMPQAERQRRPWEKQKGEPAKFYTRFCVYRDMGPGRSVRQACEIKRLPGNVQKGTYHTWATYASRWNWYQRALAYDEYKQALSDQRAADALIAEADRQAEENALHAGLRISEIRELRIGLQQAVQLALPVALLRLKTAHAELAVLKEPPEGKETPKQHRQRQALIALATKQAIQDATGLLYLAAKAYPALQKAELLNLGEVTDRAATRVEGDGLASQIVALLLAKAESADGPDLPALAALREQLAGLNGGNGKAEGDA